MKIQIRFNTDKLKTPGGDAPEWRVLIDGEQRLAKNVVIRVPSWTTMDEVSPGVHKWHITCQGSPVWEAESDTVTIS